MGGDGKWDIAGSASLASVFRYVCGGFSFDFESFKRSNSHKQVLYSFWVCLCGVEFNLNILVK